MRIGTTTNTTVPQVQGAADPVHGYRKRLSLRLKALRAATRMHSAILVAASAILEGSRDLDQSRTGEGHPPKRILVLRLDELGDVVLTTPLLAEIRHHFPDAQVELVVRPSIASVIEGSPLVDEVTVFDTAVWRILRPVVLPVLALRWRRRRRRYPRPDVVLNARPGPDAAYAGFLALLSGAAIRIGVTEHATARKAIFNAGFDRFYTHVVGGPRVIHDADASLALLRPLGIEPRTANAQLSRGGTLPQSYPIRPSSGPMIALCVSGGHSVLKRWPVDRFSQLAAMLHSQLGATVILVGDRNDSLTAAHVSWPQGTVELAGKTPLPDLVTILSNVDAYVGGDIGPTHIAAAVGTPTIALFGSSVPAVFGPRGRNITVLWHRLPCNPASLGTIADGSAWSAQYFGAERCTRCVFTTPRCMDALDVNEVFEAVSRACKEQSQPSDPVR